MKRKIQHYPKLLTRTVPEVSLNKNKKGAIDPILLALSVIIALLLLVLSKQNAHADVVLSPHFKLNEFNQRHAPLPESSLKIDPLLVKRLEDLRKIVMNRPIIVISGYRSLPYNTKVGGAKHSQHMLGKAADIRVDGVDNRMLAKYAYIVGFTFVKVYSTHVHVDVR